MENWIKRFEKLMLDTLVIEAKDHKKNYLPPKLYKYRTLNEYTLSALLEEKIWLANATTMNDPYESTIRLDYENIGNKILSDTPFTESDKANFLKLGYSEDIFKDIKSSDSVLRHTIDLLRTKSSNLNQYDELVAAYDAKARNDFKVQIESFINHLRSIVRFCSFSERNDSLLMWSHYSDQHQGICIEYNINNSEFISDCTYPVLYSNTPFDATPYFLDKQKTALISILASLYKAEDWNYEKEWRFTVPNNILQSDQLFPIGKPTGIYLGSQISNITDNDKKVILRKILDYGLENDIPFFNMALDRERFKMIPTLRVGSDYQRL